jgi:hypothetical protein
MKFLKVIALIGRFFGLMPLVRVFTTKELEDSLTDAGFEIDYQWRAGKGEAVFIVAKKAREVTCGKRRLGQEDVHHRCRS